MSLAATITDEMKKAGKVLLSPTALKIAGAAGLCAFGATAAEALSQFSPSAEEVAREYCANFISEATARRVHGVVVHGILGVAVGAVAYFVLSQLNRNDDLGNPDHISAAFDLFPETRYPTLTAILAITAGLGAFTYTNSRSADEDKTLLNEIKKNYCSQIPTKSGNGAVDGLHPTRAVSNLIITPSGRRLII